MKPEEMKKSVATISVAVLLLTFAALMVVVEVNGRQDTGNSVNQRAKSILLIKGVPSLRGI